MATRQEKIQYIIGLLKQKMEDKIIVPEFISFSSEECSYITPSELLQVLEILEQQPNCIFLKYRHRYRNEHAIYADDQLRHELQDDKIMLSDIPGAYESEIKSLLEIIDCSVKLLPDFDLGVQNALANKYGNTVIKDTDVALRLIVNNDNVLIKLVKLGKTYVVKDLSRSPIYKTILEYAEQHQNFPFKPNEVYKNTYNTYDLLKRIFHSAMIYKAFFVISGDNGSELIANFCPTYGRLREVGIDIQTIRNTLEDLES